MATTEPVAIIGMAGRFPGADDIEEYWANLVAGRDCLTELSDEELLRYHEDPHRMAHPDYVRRRPIIPDSDAFDADLFGMTPREAELRDPQYRVMLETVHATLEHAGYDPARYPHQLGLFAATNANRYRYDYVERDQDLVQSVGYTAIDIANHPDYLSTFISYKLGLRGPSVTVLTACSSSLTAVHLACTALRAGDCEMAVAGGVDLEFPYHRGYVPMHGGIAAWDGVVRSFDIDGTGTNFGDGAGAVLLKPLAAAQRDDDTIYAVILGSALNNDGDRKVGYTAPSVHGQSECIRRALRASGVRPADISYVEAHGTGTRVGDPIEMGGLIDAYRAASPAPLPPQYCGIGSVKANIGHLGQAAGVAALIKTTLALTRQVLPPSINASTPNPEVDWHSSPFYLHTELREWPAEPGRPRRAGVSSFGVGGTNAHLVLEEAPDPTRSGHRRPAEVLTWSAMDRTAENQLRERLAGHFAQVPEDRFADAAYTLRIGRTSRPVRAALLAADAAEAAHRLRSGDQVITWDGVPRETVFVFPGQGAQHPGMFRSLYDGEPMFRGGCDAAFDVLEPLLERDLRALWRSTTEPGPLAATEVAQPLLYVLEYTLAHCLMHWGVTPAALLGHSLGELVAAAVAGVFDFEDGLRAVAARARFVQQMPRGSMLAVAADVATVRSLLPEEVCVAAVNGPKQVVLSGPDDAVGELTGKLAAHKLASRALTTTHAFHSSSMAEAASRFEAALGELTLHRPAVPVMSAAAGGVLDDVAATSAAFWARQLVQPVDFDAAATEIFADGPVNVVEVGPGRTLTALLRGRADARRTGSRCLPMGGAEDDRSALGETLARLWVDGAPVNLAGRDDGLGYGRVAVPGYPYQRRRFWVDPVAEAVAPAASGGAEPAAASTEPAEPVAVARPVAQAEPRPHRRWRLGELRWVRAAAPVRDTPVVPHSAALLLAPGDPAAARSTQAALQQAGHRTWRVSGGGPGEGAGPPAFDATDPDAWLAELDRIAAVHEGPVLIAHARLVSAPPTVDRADLETQLAAGVDSVHAALTAAAAFQRRRRLPTRLAVLGRAMVDVTGGEPVNPAHAAVLGLLRSAEKEMPAVPCQAVDVGDRAAQWAVGDAISRAGERLVAVRGGATWLPRLAPVPDGGDAQPPIRYRGTYLVTGGLGGLGLVVARALAETGRQPNLVLLGRTALADLADRERVDAALTALADAGAEVATFACDVADATALASVVDAVQQRFGPVNGVVHAAGVAGGGLLERRGTAEVRRVLRPKAAGVLAVEEVFADRVPLDFLVLFSSAAALTGMYGSADYAAANAFLDAFSITRSAGQCRTVSVQWPGWAEVGMLARSPAGRALLASHEAGDPPATARGPAAAQGTDPDVSLDVVYQPGRDWLFDEHLFEGVPVLPGTGLLELVVLGAQAAAEEPASWPVDVRDLVFLAPLIGDGPRRVRVLVRRSAGGRRVVVQSRPADPPGPWTEHATARVVEPEPAPGAELDRLRARLAEPTRNELAGWIEFGPRWDTITEVRGNDHERLAKLVLHPDYGPDLVDHPVHPAIVDVASGVLHDLQPGAAYAPFMYRRVVALGPLTPEVYVHARFSDGPRTHLRAIDFDIYDAATGRLLFRAESFAMRAVDERGLGAARGDRSVAADGPPAPETLLPDEGAAIFLELLGGAHAPVVLVDLAGAPVPDVHWVDQAPPTAEVVARPAAQARDQVRVERPAVEPPADRTDSVLSQLRELWSAALGVEDIGADDDFFQLGGNSLAAVQLTSRINAHFKLDLGAGTLFDFPTLSALAKEIPAMLESAARPARVG